MSVLEKRLSARCVSRRPLVFPMVLYPLTPPDWRSQPQASLARHIGGPAARSVILLLHPPTRISPPRVTRIASKRLEVR